MCPGTSLTVQWLGLLTFTAEGPGSIPGRGTKIPQATWCASPPPKKKIKKIMCLMKSNINSQNLAKNRAKINKGNFS